MLKSEKHQFAIKQIKGVIEGELNLTTNLANTCAILKENMGPFWVGFYGVEDTQLVLGPFQGPVACTRIAYGKGVCGKAWKQKRSLLVPDVNDFAGHIVCNSESRSEIAVPIIKEDEVRLILDLDSTELNAFDEQDQKYLEVLATLISKLL